MTTNDDDKGINYTGPALEHDYTLPELVGLPTWRLVLVCDWGERTMSLDSRLASDTSVPGDEWHGHAQAFTVPIMGKADALALVAELTPLVARVCDGYRSEWDGSNHVAKLTDDAAETIEAIDCAIHDLQPDHVDGAGELWAARDWLGADPPKVAADATDADIDALAAELQDTAHGEGLHLHGLDRYLEELRSDAQDRVAEGGDA